MEKMATLQNLGEGLLAMTNLEEGSRYCQPSVVLPRSYASTLHALLCATEESFAPVPAKESAITSMTKYDADRQQ